MRSIAWVAATVLGTAFLLPQVSSPAFAQGPPALRNLTGRYRSTGDATKSVLLSPLAHGVYRATGDGWEGVGQFDGITYWGVFWLHGEPGQQTMGTHRGAIRRDGSLAILGEFAGGRGKPLELVWVPERPYPPPPQSELPVPTFENPVWPPRNQAPDPDRLPALGDYVYVEELPEAITKVPPVYPQSARDAKLEGTVLVQALVGKEGRVLDTKIVKSIPELDEAAATAVRQWVFKPALAGGKPVAVWVAVPIRFSHR